MPFNWTDAALNARADAEALLVDAFSLHTGDPGAAGTSNEATGGSPAYARITPTWEAAGVEGALGASQPATVGIAWTDVTFDVPAGDYTYIGAWDGATFLGSELITTQSFTGQGTLQLSIPLTSIIA